MITALATVLAACSNSTAPDTTTGTISPAAQEALDKAYEGIGGDLSDLPSVTPQEGIKFYVMSCGQALSTCANVAQAMADAGNAAGWDTTIVDGQLNPAGFAAAIRQAIAGGADVIIPVGIDCAAAQAAFKEAHDAGIMIVGGGGPDDCDPKIWDSERLWLDGKGTVDVFNLYGSFAADWAYGKTNGNVKAITLTATTNVWGQWIEDGFRAELEALGGGEIVANVDIADPETADGSFIQKVTTALLAHPEATVLQVPVATWLSTGLYQAIVSSGRTNLVIATSQSDPSVMDTIRAGSRNGIEVGAAAQALAWGAWGSIDTAIRLLAGQEPVYIGESIQVVDADHNLPASGDYNGSIDWQAAFLESWGRS